MDIGWFAGVTGFAFAMAATPGPNNTIVAASGASFGIARTLPLMAGIGTGVGAIMLVVATFGSSVVADPWVGAALKWIGVLYLLWMAWKVASAEPEVRRDDGKASSSSTPLSFVDGAVFQFVNPKLWVMVSGAVVTYGQMASGFSAFTLAVLLGVVFGLMTFISTVAWTALGASVGRVLTSRRSMRFFNVVMAILLLATFVPIVRQ